MRSFTPALFAVSLCLPLAMTASPAPASAAANAVAQKARAKPKAKAPKAVLNGAGQRLHFTFGGRITHNQATNALKGKFRIIVHPLSPPGSVVNTTCVYKTFNNPQQEGRTLTWDAHGTCTTLRLNGSISRTAAHNRITIVDAVSGTDTIDVEPIGGTGISVPGGPLSHGSFTFTPPDGPAQQG